MIKKIVRYIKKFKEQYNKDAETMEMYLRYHKERTRMAQLEKKALDRVFKKNGYEWLIESWLDEDEEKEWFRLRDKIYKKERERRNKK